MPELYIPPPQISFRLKSYSTNYVLYSRHSNEPTFDHFGGSIFDDQWWQLIPGTGKHSGYYLIKSKKTGKVLFSRNSPAPYVGHVGGNGQYDDNYFKLEAGSGKHANHFRLRNYASDTVIYSRLTRTPNLGNYDAWRTVYDDQYWMFHFEDMEISRITYQIDQGKIIASNTEQLGSETVTNNSSINQTAEFDFSETKTTSSTFERTHGFTISAGESGKLEVPFVADYTLKLELSTTHTFKWGETATESKLYAARFPATAAPHTKITATATITRSQIAVPFTIYSKSVSTGYEVATHGTYRGITYWNICSDIKETKL
ncbi:hypothetical protein PRK78_005910 [Emydomyces testavorans]|uniref:Uncharacterized protein n=1 Tax=Emydomyces testavorans TaxID=2070801 RepID=A0AAF0DLE6_9EURO|nr:hypothetical protein PRK78_005910 [Emydomyces testavorans]